MWFCCYSGSNPGMRLACEEPRETAVLYKLVSTTACTVLGAASLFQQSLQIASNSTMQI